MSRTVCVITQGRSLVAIATLLPPHIHLDTNLVNPLVRNHSAPPRPSARPAVPSRGPRRRRPPPAAAFSESPGLGPPLAVILPSAALESTWSSPLPPTGGNRSSSTKQPCTKARAFAFRPLPLPAGLPGHLPPSPRSGNAVRARVFFLNAPLCPYACGGAVSRTRPGVCWWNSRSQSLACVGGGGGTRPHPHCAAPLLAVQWVRGGGAAGERGARPTCSLLCSALRGPAARCRGGGSSGDGKKEQRRGWGDRMASGRPRVGT